MENSLAPIDVLVRMQTNCEKHQHAHTTLFQKLLCATAELFETCQKSFPLFFFYLFAASGSDYRFRSAAILFRLFPSLLLLLLSPRCLFIRKGMEGSLSHIRCISHCAVRCRERRRPFVLFLFLHTLYILEAGFLVGKSPSAAAQQPLHSLICRCCLRPNSCYYNTNWNYCSILFSWQETPLQHLGYPQLVTDRLRQTSPTQLRR